MTERYDRIGEGYNGTRKADPYLYERMKSLLKPEREKTYLDLGCGTGNYTALFQSDAYRFIGMDPSEYMLNLAKERKPKELWLKGRADSIPLPDESIHGALSTLSIHHWEDLDASFKELNRVLYPKSQYLIFTSSPAQMRSYWLSHYFPEMMRKAIAQMPDPEQMKEALSRCGFDLVKRELYVVQPDLKDQFLYVGKERPELYLNKEIRKGISSFAMLTDKDELEQGLELLRQDMKTGTWTEVRKKYRNNEGDYLFLLIRKR